MNDPIITLKSLDIGYNNQSVLSGISLSIARSSFTAILGANGSGKSTLLKTILRLQPPIKGILSFAGPITFGYVPQSIQFDSLYPLMGFDVALMGTYGRIKPGRMIPSVERDFVWECLRSSAAEGFAQRKFVELSGGQKQRVLMARALATRPNVLVLDEPTAGVDVAATRALLEFISQIHQKQKLTILLVTHDLPLVRKHAQQVIWLHQGQVLHGPVTELLTKERMSEILEIEIS